METFKKRLSRIAPETKRFIDHSMGIAEQLMSYMEENKLNQKQLASKLKRKESEISKWLSGEHNFTIATVGKIEADLGIEIIPFFGNGFKHGRKRSPPIAAMLGKEKVIYHHFSSSHMSSERKPIWEVNRISRKEEINILTVPN